MQPERSGSLDWINSLELRTHIAAGRRRKRGCPDIRARNGQTIGNLGSALSVPVLANEETISRNKMSDRIR
jgi:hypothetical protein